LNNKLTESSHSATLDVVTIFLALATSALFALTIKIPAIYWPAVGIVVILSLISKLESIWIFSFAFWVFYPSEYITVDPLLNFFSPSSILLVILSVRTPKKQTFRGSFLFGALAILLLISSSSSVGPLRSLGWAFQLLTVAWLLTYQRKEVGTHLKFRMTRVIAWCSISVGVLGGLEYLLRRTLIYTGSVFPAYTEAYKWVFFSTFRIQTTLGHPLNNGLFFSTCALICFIGWVQLEKHQILFVAFILCSISTLLSGSRTAVLALLGGTLLVLVLMWGQLKPSQRTLFFLVSPPSIILFTFSPIFQSLLSRNQSGEGIESQKYRADILNWVPYFLKTYTYRGSGPATSGQVWSQIGNGAPLENGILQMWVSLGLFLTVFILLAGIWFLLRAFSDKSWIALLPSILYIPTTNFIEDSSSYLILIGLLVSFTKLFWADGVSEESQRYWTGEVDEVGR
jgi:hypothetical protein